MDLSLLMLVLGALVLVLGLALFALLLRMARVRSAKQHHEQQDLSIDVAALDAVGPSEDGPRLEFYGTPVRLAVLVLAPAGRTGVLPDDEKLREACDHLIPGLAAVLDAHHPIFRRWPEQLSSQGFAQSFFSNLRLPGDRGKGTPWCSAAGKFEFGGQQLLAGLVCCAEKPTGLSQVVVQHEGQWLDVLRVRS
jgi:hypothetical protein